MERQFMNNIQLNIGLAVDLGSTTIAVSCYNIEQMDEICSFSFVNPQYIYGADVITRIKHCIENSEMLNKLGDMVREALAKQLNDNLTTLLYDISKVILSKVVISGNTTMLHIMRGLSVDGLARAPFTPVDIEYIEEQITFGDSQITICYPPGFSAFVGADILVGAQYLQMGNTDKYELLIDLGTNGEMLLMNWDNGYVASTACGPVFDHVIAGAAYGSESMKRIANCVKRGLIDRSGTIAEPFFEKGISIDKNYTIRQENVRNFQLAKGAIYAGIQCLLDKAGITVNDIGKVYVSGGLGFYMDKRDAFILKMLPMEFADKILVSGNTSLMGATRLLLADEKEKELLLAEYDRIYKKTVSFELANMEGFQERYMQSLEF